MLPSELRRLRLERNMTQAALAARAGISREQVSRLERGLASPRYTTLYALSRAVGVPVTHFLRTDASARGPPENGP